MSRATARLFGTRLAARDALLLFGQGVSGGTTAGGVLIVLASCRWCCRASTKKRAPP